MSIVRRHRQTVIDHDPRTGAVVGATKIFARHVEENGQNLGKLEAENEPVDVAEVPKLWGGTSDENVVALARTEAILQKERDAWAARETELLARQSELETLLGERSTDCDRYKGMLIAIQRAVSTL